MKKQVGFRKQVYDAIAKEFPNVKLRKDKTYFYIYSDDTATGMKIAGLPSSGIYVYRLSDLSVEQWVESVRALFNAEEKD